MADPVDEADLEWQEYDRGDARFRRKRLAGAAGGDRLGCSLYELEPSDRAWPYHYHTANEEAMYVLSGSGRVRGPDGESPVTAGDYLAFTVGADGGHRIVNDSEEPLRFLLFSTMVEPDVTVYPDTAKFGVYVGAPPGSTDERTLSGYYRIGDDVDYWEGFEAEPDEVEVADDEGGTHTEGESENERAERPE